MEHFRLSRGVTIQEIEKQEIAKSAGAEGGAVRCEAVKRAIARFYRDLEMSLEEPEDGTNLPAGKIYLEFCHMDAEQYQISVENGSEILIRAGKSWGLSMGFYLSASAILGSIRSGFGMTRSSRSGGRF